MNIADFSAISNGKYNLGSIRLQGEGEQASLVKINNHRWRSNNVPDDPAANVRVRQALCDAIRREAGIPQEVIDRLVGDLTSAEHLNQPLDRRQVRSVLQQIGESRLMDKGVYVKFTGKPELNKAIAMTALACLPQQKNNQPEVSKMIVAAAVKAFEKGDLKVNKDFSKEARVQVFHTMFKGLDLKDMPTDAQLRAMTPEDFFAFCAGAFDRIADRLRSHTADVLFPANSLFSKFRGNEDWDSSAMHDQQMLMGNQLGGAIFSPGDLGTLKSGVKAFDLSNLPAMKVAMESRIGSWIADFREMDLQMVDRKCESKIEKDITRSRLHGELRFSINNDAEFVTFDPKSDALGAYGSNRRWMKTKIDDTAMTKRQAVTAKLLMTQEPLQPFREFAHMLGLEEYDEHTGFNYTLNNNEDESLSLEIKKDFTEYGAKNISASFSWRIGKDGSATLEDFRIKLPR